MLFLPDWDTRRGEEFSERGRNSFKLCPTYFTGAETIFRVSLAPLRLPSYAPEYECEAGYLWSNLSNLG